MTREYTMEDHQKYREQEDARIKREEEERQERLLKAELRARWIQENGTDAGFDAAYPRIAENVRRERTEEAARTAEQIARVHTRRYSRI